MPRPRVAGVVETHPAEFTKAVQISECQVLGSFCHTCLSTEHREKSYQDTVFKASVCAGTSVFESVSMGLIFAFTLAELRCESRPHSLDINHGHHCLLVTVLAHRCA